MLLSQLTSVVPLRHICGPQIESFDGVYAGDLLSRAMSRVRSDNLWITIMNNTNVIAVASLTEAAAVVLAEDVEMTSEAVQAAEENGISVYSSSESVYNLCAAIARMA